MFTDYVRCLIIDISYVGTDRFGPVKAEVAVLYACTVAVGA